MCVFYLFLLCITLYDFIAVLFNLLNLLYFYEFLLIAYFEVFNSFILPHLLNVFCHPHALFCILLCLVVWYPVCALSKNFVNFRGAI